MKYIILLALLIAASGCVSQNARNSGLVVTLSADPPGIFQNQQTTLFVDIDNTDEKTLNNVVFELFDTGIMDVVDTAQNQVDKTKNCIQRDCRISCAKFSPKEFQTFSCKLKAPEVMESTTSTVNAKTTFSSELDVVQLIEMISRQEYERRQASGTFSTLPRKYTYSDRNIALDMEFSEDLPVIERSEKRYFIHLTIINIGDGFVGDLGPNDFLVFQGTNANSQTKITTEQVKAKGGVLIDLVKDIESIHVTPVEGDVDRIKTSIYGSLVKCEKLDEMKKTNGKLSPLGKTFPRITCELTPPDSIDVIGNYPMGIKILYDYETRQNIGIRIMK